MPPKISCKGCGADTRNRAYCSRSCSQRSRHRSANAQKVARWLATGKGRPHERRDHWMRVYLLEDQQQRCALCPQEQSWNGSPLVFVLDHVDGDATNHERSNVRMLCPNCNSQLPTHCGGNRGNGRRSARMAPDTEGGA